MSLLRASVFAGVIFVSFCSGAFAQLNNEWAEFANQTGTRLVDGTFVGHVFNATDADEKDYAWGDLDKDGDLDLVCVRKQPFTTNGKRSNVLFINEGVREGRPFDGVLVDRTNLYAVDADVGGDQGFMTPTNDRDVFIADVDNDGWLDVVTCTALSDGDPKWISHPRIYHNKGSVGGVWQGLKFENSRFPQFICSGLPVAPRFCGVAAGDVTGDGYADLYFADYDSGSPVETCDLNDRLLINGGAASPGVFTDQTAMRMTSAMNSSGFGTSCSVVDYNLDGKSDIGKSFAGSANVVYNNPANPGFFNVLQNFYGGSAYFFSTGDLNNDGRPDAIISDDGADKYILNTGTDALGRAIWSAPFAYSFVTGADDGFGAESRVADFNNDGFNDVLIADVDVDIPGCGRRLHLYHNLGNVPNVTIKEEAGSTGWAGAKGLLPANLQGTHTTAPFDINNDGWTDLAIGRCTGNSIWINRPKGLDSYGNGTPGCSGVITMSGNKVPKQGTASFAFVSNRAPANAAGIFFIGDVQDLAGSADPFGLGVLLHVSLLSPFQFIGTMFSDAAGHAEFPIALPPGSAGFIVYAQSFWVYPPGACTPMPSVSGFASSSGLKLTIQP